MTTPNNHSFENRPAVSIAPRTATTHRFSHQPHVLRLTAGAIILVTVGFLLIGCGNKKAKTITPATPDAAQVTTPSPADPVQPSASPVTEEKARIAQALAQRAGIEPSAPALKLRGGEMATPEVLAAYNQELARAIFQQKDAPETLEELVRKWRLPKLPTAPAGKQIIYDPVNRIIRLDPP